MTGVRVRTGTRSRLQRLRLPLYAGLAAAMLFPVYDVLAQADKQSDKKDKKDSTVSQATIDAQQVFLQLQQQIQALRVSEGRLMQQKESEAQSKLAKQQEQTRQMNARRDRAEDYSKVLDAKWEENDKKLSEL